MTDETRALLDVKDSVDALAAQFDALTKEVRAQRTWTRHRLWGLGVVVVALIIALTLGGVGLTYSVKEARCNRAFNDATAQRTSVLSPATVELNVANGELIKTVKPSVGESQAEQLSAFNDALAKYYTALDKYLNAVVRNPAPLAPKFTC